MKRTAILAAVAAFALGLFGQPTRSVAQVEGAIIKKGTGQQVAGTIKWKRVTKEFEVTASGVSVVIPSSQVERLMVRKGPASLDPAVKTVQRGEYTGRAVQELEKIVAQYEMLEYDLVAGRWLAFAYVNSGKAKQAVDVCEKLMADRAQSSLPGELVRVYWDALLQNGQDAKLRMQLRSFVEQGSRYVAAVAQLKRGDLDRKNGNYREALIGGYLRTVILFQDFKEVQPEALYYAVKCFEQLGQSSHAEKMRKKLLADYPDDSYSRKLQSGS